VPLAERVLADRPLRGSERFGFTAGEGGMGALAIDALNGQDCARTMFLGG